jgi:ubiquinone/menaquinone biosynthesis C-methylase UbiE
MDIASSVAPNHHASYPGFAGITGLLAAATMVVGRGSTARWAAALTAVGADLRVVDVGCGPGTAVREAADRGALATGVDPAPVMLRVARLLTRSPRITWRRGAAEALPLPDQSADIVWSIASVHHWRDLDAGLREVLRVLVPGGRFLAIEAATRPGATGHASHGWTDEQAEVFLERCRAAGLVDGRVERRPRGRHALVAVLATRPTVAA